MPTFRLHADEEHLPFRENMFDLVISSLRYCVICCVLCCTVYTLRSYCFMWNCFGLGIVMTDDKVEWVCEHVDHSNLFLPLLIPVIFPFTFLSVNHFHCATHMHSSAVCAVVQLLKHQSSSSARQLALDCSLGTVVYGHQTWNIYHKGSLHCGALNKRG